MHHLDPRRGIAHWRLHGRLNRFVAPGRRGRWFDTAFDGSPALKDPLEAAGVPHREVANVRVDGREASLATRLQGGERIEVSAVERQGAGDPPRFVLDVHLGRLAGYLRLLGIDTAYGRAWSDARLQRIAATERRVLLTRDVALLKRKDIPAGAFVHATDPRAQLAETMERFELAPHVQPFSRCGRCNGKVDAVPRADITRDVPPRVLERATRFSRCRDCGRIYWRGSHEDALRRRLAEFGVAFDPPPSPPSGIDDSTHDIP